jgi:hypothetical protein
MRSSIVMSLLVTDYVGRRRSRSRLPDIVIWG